MAKVQANDVVSNAYCGPDRRNRGFLGRARRRLIAVVRNRWIAMFAIAFAVSWSFHEVDERGQHRIERQQRITLCVITGVATQQQFHPHSRVIIGPILQVCQKQRGK